MLPSHSQTAFFLQSGIFNDLSHFSQWEARAAALPTAEEQQALFAVFAEAFLAIRPLPQATDIWPEGLIPAEARRRYALPEQIVGAEGIFRTLSGEIHPYQLLFRPPIHGQRPSLSRKDIAGFLTLADRVPQPLFITNCTLLPTDLQNRSGFHCIRGSDLDQLTPPIFQAMRRWLQGGGIVPNRTPLLPHHARAVAGLQPLLEAGDRAVGLTAPGTAVELLALKLAEGVGSGRTVLLLLPSLAHMRDLLLLWRHHTVWSDLSCLWVCADPVKGQDSPVVRQADLDIPLVSDSEAVRRFLAWRFRGVRVLITTYASARITARAMIGFAPMDLGLFLESRESISDPFCLDDTNLSIRKRLFLESTLHHANALIKQPNDPDKKKDLPILWSLEDPTLYGAVVPIAPLAEAVANGLRPWKFVLVIVPPEAALTSRELACDYAIRLVLSHTPPDQEIHHIHTYHDSNQAAKLFAGIAAEENSEPVFTRLYLEGNSVAALRDETIRLFSRAHSAILSSSRCLAESLNPPRADMVVFFASPKKTKLPITQALAAILGKKAGQPTGEGVICLPIFTTEEHAVEHSLQDSDTLWEVLQVLRELDSSLDAQIRQAGETYGETGQWPALFKPFSILLPDGLNTGTTESVWHAVLQRLSTTWDQRLGQLHRYDWDTLPGLEAWVKQQRLDYSQEKLPRERVLRLEKFGFIWDPKKATWNNHCADFERYQRQHGYHYPRREGEPPPPMPEEAELADWMHQQRKLRLKGQLDAESIARLDRLGFVWDPDLMAWMALFSKLKSFQRYPLTERSCLIPESWPENPALAEWAKQQRLLYAKSKLDPERVERLNGLGFVWDLEKAHWDRLFSAFLQFKRDQGHGKIPEIWPENPELAEWAKQQRKTKEQDKLAAERVARLEEQGFCWNLEVAYWEEMAAALADYRQQQGHSQVPPGYADNRPLADWVIQQRRVFAAGRLEERRIDCLNALDFVWDPEEKAWREMYDLLEALHAKEGHCLPQDGSDLATWCQQQRLADTRSGHKSLRSEWRADLNRLGFIWDGKEAEWETLFLQLQNFRKERKHCIVPAKVPDGSPHQPLARWVALQRRGYAKGILDEEKKQRLDALGFVWDAKAIFWEEMFAALAEFRDLHGNCLVPERYEPNSQLAWWVTAQRKAYKTEQLEAERVTRLNDLGFFWDPMEAQWYEMYQALVHYRERFGHCLVRGLGSDRAKLAAWLNTQRQARLHGHLSSIRIERLDALGLIWDPKEIVVEEMLAELEDFKSKHGHCAVPAQCKENPALGLWVQFQRQAYKKGTLDVKRIQRLEALGISWE